MPSPASSPRLTVSDLPTSRPTRFELAPSDAEMTRIAQELKIDGLRKLRFKGEITAEGKSDWRLVGHLGATVVQPCVVTLAPVTTRIEEKITRRLLAHLPDLESEEDEIEMPEDDSIEQLTSVIDLSLIMQEALALALPMYPRAEDASLSQAQFAEPGTTPMQDEDARPFAGLKALKDKLEGDD